MKIRIISLLLVINFALANSAYAMDTSHEESKCAELGFTKQTEAFGNCVLKLIGRNQAARDAYAAERPNYHELEAQRLLESARRKLDAIDRDRDADRDRYADRARQMRAEDDAERRRQAQSTIDYANREIDANRRAMCQSWGNRYCD
jgi:hypothetical protein